MKRLTWLLILSAIILGIAACSGQAAVTPAPATPEAGTTTAAATPEPTTELTPEVTPIPEKSVSEDDRPAMMNDEIAAAPLMNNGLSLDKIIPFLNADEDSLSALCGEDLELIKDNGTYKEYLSEKLGLRFNFYYDEEARDYYVKYIDLDEDKISFNGINKDMNFNEVMSILGEAKIICNNDGLPGLNSYELRYRNGNACLRIYSWDKDGNDGIHISVVDKFIPQYRTIRITPEDIEKYFEMTKDEIQDALGVPDDASYDYWFDYSKYGASFTFNDLKLYSMDLDANYQINELMQGINLKNSIKLMGKGKIKKHETSEDGPMYYAEYKYGNFILEVGYLKIEGWPTGWEILCKDYMELNEGVEGED